MLQSCSKKKISQCLSKPANFPREYFDARLKIYLQHFERRREYLYSIFLYVSLFSVHTCQQWNFFRASSCFLEIPFLNYSLIGCDLRALFGLNRSGVFFHASPSRELCLIFYCVPVIHFYPIIRLRFFHSSKDDNSFLNFIHNHTHQSARARVFQNKL